MLNTWQQAIAKLRAFCSSKPRSMSDIAAMLQQLTC
jgi:hypothetical protein